MPAGRQDSSLFYAVVVFVSLFIVSTVFAVIFYVKFSDLQKTVLDAEKRVAELASSKEVKNVGALVGSKEQRTVLGTMLIRFDTLANLVLGNSVPSDTSAEAKLDAAKQQTAAILAQLNLATGDSNSTGLIQALQTLKSQYDDGQVQVAATNQKLIELTQTFDEDKKASVDKEKETAVFMTKLKDDSDRATKGYEDLKALMQKDADTRVAGLTTKLDGTEQEFKKLQAQYLATQAKLNNANDRIGNVQQQLEMIVPKPDNSTAAFKADGKIVSIDNATKTVIINLGSNDRIYRGLTFSVYDKSLPIPRDGKGKATVEVFDVQQKVAAARITSNDKGNPIRQDDTIANLIWDSKTKREFVVAGTFAFGDGIASVQDMVRRWGGVVADSITIKTNFIVLGTAPVNPPKPTVEQIEADSRAMEKYDAQLKQVSEYNVIIGHAKALSIPVFSLERFLDFVGYTAPAAGK